MRPPNHPAQGTATVSPFFTQTEAADYLLLKPRTLANYRSSGKGPRYVRSGSRALYRQSDLDNWLDEHTFAHTAEERARRAGDAGGRRRS